MAFIPDEAVMRSGEIPPGAFRLYAYYCMRRDGATGLCFPSLKRAQTDLGFQSYSYTSEMRSTLTRLGWVELTGDGQVCPLMGFREKPTQLSGKTEHASEISEPGFGKNRTEVRKKPNAVSEKTEPHIKEEPAPLTSPLEPAPSREPRQSPVGDQAVKICRQLTHRNPNQTQRERIVAEVTNLERWRETVEQFMVEGQPPQHVDWMLERYRNGHKRKVTAAELNQGGRGLVL